MPRKSLVQHCSVDQAQRAHNCQANARHRLQQGDRRLKVKVNRSSDHYCAECALKIIENDIAKLQKLARQLRDDALKV